MTVTNVTNDQAPSFLYLLRWMLIGLVFGSCAGNLKSRLPQTKELEVPKSVTNYLTEQYKDIPGTKLSLIVPDSFSYDAALGGFASQSKQTWIIASSLQTKPLLAAGVYKSRLTDKSRPDALDGELLGEWDLSINAQPVRLFKVATALGNREYLQYALFLGDTSGSYRIIGSVHEDELTLASKIQSSLLSIFFDADRKIGGNGIQTSSSPCNCERDKH